MVFGLFKKNKKQSKDDRYLTLTIKEVNQIAKDTANVVFHQPEETFDYQPGQFITVIAEIGGKKIRRAYSLCTTPFEDADPAITVKRVPDGLMSNHVHDYFRAGDEIQVMEPMGMFTTQFDESKERHAVFFGGGSGITPLISIIRSCLIKEPKSRITLVFANRSKEYIAFHELLINLESKFKDRFSVIHVLEDDSEKMADYTGRFTPSLVVDICDRIGVSPATEFYICGPEPMMNIIDEGLKSNAIKPGQIRMESFEAGKTSPIDVVADESKEISSSEVTILMDGQEYVIQVPGDTPILEAGLDNDLDMPYSCQSGLCTACRGKCLEGEISLDDAEGISKEEIEEGYRLLCVGKPKSDKIRVEIG